MRPGARAGITLVETLVALLLGLMLVQGAVGVAVRVRLLHRQVVERADLLASVRLAASLLRTETETAMRGRDWDVFDDSLSLRAFRGTGLVCAEASVRDALAVSYVGYRRPDPSKDSLLVVYAMGAVSVVGLAGVESGPDVCGDQPLGQGVVLRMSEPVPTGAVVARVFERGAYSISVAALRYRRGAGGRQPLTAEAFDTDSGWRWDGERLGVELIERVTPTSPGYRPDGTVAPPARWRIAVSGGSSP
ncbi:MAG: hypothetical protein WD995_12550 [Gemmatimonadota bacterium]